MPAPTCLPKKNWTASVHPVPTAAPQPAPNKFWQPSPPQAIGGWTRHPISMERVHLGGPPIDPPRCFHGHPNCYCDEPRYYLNGGNLIDSPHPMGYHSNRIEIRRGGWPHLILDGPPRYHIGKKVWEQPKKDKYTIYREAREREAWHQLSIDHRYTLKFQWWH